VPDREPHRSSWGQLQALAWHRHVTLQNVVLAKVLRRDARRREGKIVVLIGKVRVRTGST
jgi:hypothetical protein